MVLHLTYAAAHVITYSHEYFQILDTQTRKWRHTLIHNVHRPQMV